MFWCKDLAKVKKRCLLFFFLPVRMLCWHFPTFQATDYSGCRLCEKPSVWLVSAHLSTNTPAEVKLNHLGWICFRSDVIQSCNAPTKMNYKLQRCSGTQKQDVASGIFRCGAFMGKGLYIATTKGFKSYKWTLKMDLDRTTWDGMCFKNMFLGHASKFRMNLPQSVVIWNNKVKGDERAVIETESKKQTKKERKTLTEVAETQIMKSTPVNPGVVLAFKSASRDQKINVF